MLHQFSILRITPLRPLVSTPPGGNCIFSTFLNNFLDNSQCSATDLDQTWLQCVWVYSNIWHNESSPSSASTTPPGGNLYFSRCWIVVFTGTTIYLTDTCGSWSSSSMVKAVQRSHAFVNPSGICQRPWTTDALALVMQVIVCVWKCTVSVSFSFSNLYVPAWTELVLGSVYQWRLPKFACVSVQFSKYVHKTYRRPW